MASKTKNQRKPRKKATEAAPAPKRVPPTVPGLEPGTACAPVPPAWEWTYRLLRHSLNMIEGRKGVGKSSILASMAAHFAGGPALPGMAPVPPRAVIWHGPEESWESAIVPRLIAHGADPAWIYRLQITGPEGRLIRPSLPSMRDELAAIIRAAGAAFLVCDPFWSLVDPGLNMSMPLDARRYMESLAELCWAGGVTAGLSRHVRKTIGGDSRDNGLGSVEIGNTCRTISLASEHPTDHALCCLATVANSWAPKTAGMVYSLTPTGSGVRLEWRGESELSADILSEGRGGGSDQDEGRDAQTLIREMLADGPRSANNIFEEARDSGIGVTALRTAKVTLGCKSMRKGGGAGGKACWYWAPPVDGWPVQ